MVPKLGQDWHVATGSSLAEAAARADAGDWPAARDAYAELLANEMSGDACHGLARACWWLGETRMALEHAECAFAAYEEEGRFADAAMVGVHLCLWYLTNFDNVAAAEGWLARARHLGQRSGNDLAVGWVTLVSGYVAGDPVEGLRLIESAASTATSLSDRDLSTMALADLGLWHVTTGEVGRGMAMLDEAMATVFATPRRMLEVVVWSSCNMLAACSLADDLRRATQWCRAADRFMDTYGCPFLQARCRAHYGSVLVATGRWEEAERELAVALSMSGDTGRGPRTEALTALAELRLRQGDHEAALILLDEADPTPAGVVTRARCLADLGRPSEARAVLKGELALQQPDNPAYPTLVAVLAETELLAGRAEEAAALLGRDASVWTAPAFPRAAGLLARAAGLLAAARGDLEAGCQQLGEALDAFARLELPFEWARTELELSRLLQQHDPEAAAARARSAMTRFETLGARREAAAAAADLRGMGFTPAPGPRRAETLSSRERDVLDLLAHGLSNPQIAERLFLSPRTVGHHVSSILHKLGVQSRAEAAAYAARKAAASNHRDR
ncbi:MAG TPA: LuxR C-terminal-related transcriptional regulator [Nocardioidaceae bacterium]|nr:LuxR C-terminal-related transcriptional regulator [Nocardioidaceae bacterium]